MRAALTATAITLLWACDDATDASPGTPLPDASAPADSAPAAPTRLSVRLADGVPGGGPLVRWALLVEGIDPEHGWTELLPAVERWPLEVDLGEVPPGTYRVTAFHDRNADGVYDPCPFPHEPGHTSRADQFDNLVGVAEGRVAGETTLEVRLERRICGPGEVATGLRGRLAPPPGVELAGIPVRMRLERAEDGAESADTMAGGILDVALLPRGLSGPVDFEVGELVPGRYTLQVYADGDEDRRPSPCGPGIGGGDRYLASLAGVEIRAGERVELAEELALVEPADCPAELTGISGSVRLAEGLPGDPGVWGEAAPPWSGELWLALLDESGTSAVRARLAPSLGAEPARFTVSGLPAGEWRMALWLDRDGNGSLTPCGGSPAGLDAIHAEAPITIREGELRAVGAWTLDQMDCGDTPPTGVTGWVQAGLEDGAVGSGRPVRLDLFASTMTERRSVLLHENHRRDGVATEDGAVLPPFFALALPPGEYSGRVYLDTNRDGAYTPCAGDPFGDRAGSEVFPVVVAEGELTDLGPLRLPAAGCDTPDSGVVIDIDASEGLDAQLATGPLRLRIEEAGGWLEDRQLQRRFDLGEERAAQRISLAPGHYRLTAYLDGDEDGCFQPCDGEAPERVAATVEVVLDAANPEARPEIVLDHSCAP